MEENQPSTVDNNRDVNDDQFLIAAAKDGDKAAYGKLVLKYQKRLVRLVFMMLGRIDAAEDIAQEALVKGYMALESFEIDRPFYPWIATIARNLALNQIKKDEKTSRIVDEDEIEIDIPDMSDNPLDKLLDKENERRLAQAILALPVAYRTAFVLRTIEKMSYEEIAEKLNISLGTVNSRISRAREKLVEMLKELL